MNIAVVFEGQLSDGGGYQTQISSLLELSKLDKYKFYIFVSSIDSYKTLQDLGFEVIFLRNNLFEKILRFFIRNDFNKKYLHKLKINIQTDFEKKLSKNNIDLVYFLAPSIRSLEIRNYNYVITVWDLCHRDFMEFPEVYNNGEFERREWLYERSLKKAVAILVDSELGKTNVIKRYGIDEHRIYVAPFTPSVNIDKHDNIDIKDKYNINGEYIYYPAGFWAHKNHIYIIDAIKILKEKGIKISAIFSGSDKGNLKYILDYIKQNNLNDTIKYIGFAPNNEIYSLYKNSLALVMPTYFGPTNIPPLEAFKMGVPVVYSNLSGLKEQVGNAALLCDLNDANDLANSLHRLLNDYQLRAKLIECGFKAIDNLNKFPNKNILVKIFDDYNIKTRCYKIKI